MNQSTHEQTRELHAHVHGRVQGVGFRYFVVNQAVALGLRGYARNDSDGSVEVLAQGPSSALESLLASLQKGPSAAHVTRVDETWREPSEYISGFHVRW